jgi:hypothetical protein
MGDILKLLKTKTIYGAIVSIALGIWSYLHNGDSSALTGYGIDTNTKSFGEGMAVLGLVAGTIRHALIKLEAKIDAFLAAIQNQKK